MAGVQAIVTEQAGIVMSRRGITVFFLCVALLLAAANSVNAEDDKLERLIENVEAGEALFRDIDVVVRETYRHEGDYYGGGDGYTPTTKSLGRVRYVRQGEKERLDVAKEISPLKKEPELHERILAYDGEYTRVLSGKTANVRSGYRGSRDQVQLHMMVIRNAGYKFPLSTYLRGTEAIRASPSGDRWPKDREVTVDLLGNETFEGRSCARVRIVNSKSGTPTIQWILWLDSERNYLPVRRECFTLRFSTSIPTGEGRVLSFKQYEPGIWIPEVVEIVAYDKFVVRREGEQVPLWRREYVIESIDLNPKYPDEYFSDITIPEGTIIHHLSADGKVLRSEFKGEPLERRKDGNFVRGLLSIAIVIVLIVFSGVLIRRRRSRTV